MNGYTWKKIWGPAGQVLFRRAGISGLFATEGPGLDPTGDLYAGGDTGSGVQWVRVGGPGRMFAAGPTDSQQPNIVGLSPDGGVHLLRYDAAPQGLTARWEQIGGPAAAIYAGEAGIFATNPDSGDLYAYHGTPMGWTQIGGPAQRIATGPYQVAAVEPGTSDLLYAIAAGAPTDVNPIVLPEPQ